MSGCPRQWVFQKHYDFRLVNVDGHPILLRPLLANIQHPLKFVRRAGYQYCIIDIEDRSHPCQGGGSGHRDLRELELEVANKVCRKDGKENRAQP